MREVEVSRLTDVIEKLCIEANEHLPEDVKCAIKTCRACEDGVENSIDILKENGIVKTGDIAVVTAGVVDYAKRHEPAASTNIMRVVNID